MSEGYDLIVIGAGSGGLVAAEFAAQLGARVALVERNRIGGDCTWTGCVPSKALIKAAKIAHEVHCARTYGIDVQPPRTDMAQVAAYVRGAIADVYRAENPAALASKGIEFVAGTAEFADANRVKVGDRTLTSNRFLICTGARAVVPDIDGLADVPFLTYDRFFDNVILPAHLLVLGSGPIGLELALAYRRLGAEVTVIGTQVLPREDPEVQTFVADLLRRERVRLIGGTATHVQHDSGRFVVESTAESITGDMLLVAVGRQPDLQGLSLERAGVAHDSGGIAVDRYLRTSVPHIYAAGDVTGSYQFTHYAAWQAFQAVRNALLPGRAVAISDVVPRVTFLDPEVAHVGLTEADARARHGDHVRVHRWDMKHADRAITDGETAGFIKLVAKENGAILGATIVASRAGEMIGEYTLALQHKLNVQDIAGTIHAYPTWATPLQQIAAQMATGRFIGGAFGRLVLRLAGFRRRAERV